MKASLILAFLTCLACTSNSAADEPFKVLTYNIRYQNQTDGQDGWDHRKETVLNTVLQADIVGLQEVVASQFDFVNANTAGWKWYGVARNDGLRDGEMAAIGWNTKRFVAVEQGTFWLGDDPFLVGKPAWDAALPRVASWVRLLDRSGSDARPVASILLVNAHFDHRGAKARKNSGTQIRKWIASHKDQSNAIFVGDLNARAGSPPLDELLNSEDSTANLFDCRDLSLEKDNGPNSTWNGFNKIEAGNRIDHVLVEGKSLEIVNYQTLDPRTASDRFASDHLPILATFRIAK